MRFRLRRRLEGRWRRRLDGRSRGRRFPHLLCSRFPLLPLLCRRRRRRPLGADLARLRSMRPRDAVDGVRPGRHEKAARETNGRSGGAGGGGKSRARVCGGAGERGVAQVGRGRGDVGAAVHRRNFAGGGAGGARAGERARAAGDFSGSWGIRARFPFPRALDGRPQINRRRYRFVPRAGRLSRARFFSRVCWSMRNGPARVKRPVYPARGVFAAAVGDALIPSKRPTSHR